MNDRVRLFIGRYTQDDPSPQPAPGITVAEFDPEALTIEPVGGGDLPEASFLALGPSRNVLYAVQEDENDGQVAAFSIDAGSNSLSFLGKQPTHGALPCHLLVEPGGSYVLAANYGTGNVTVLPIETDGSLAASSDLSQHTGSGPNADRQGGPHAHMVAAAPDGQVVLSVDLGTDSVYAYALDALSGRLTLIAQNRMRPGSGPRHLVFHPSGEHFYLANELGNSVTVCAYDAATGSAKELAEIPAVPDPRGGENAPGGIVLSADARFVYVSNRGDESVCAFEVGDGGSRLEPVGRWSCEGSWPRDIALSPDGRFLFVANQRSHNVAVLRVDGDSGALSDTGLSYPVRNVAHTLFG
ncbi:lactonase family protein [Actinocrinis sp.]|uniref:lactonase family protein n=1 Tax=Actinocrinis sp. TaxID=1920516 RepID=UPI002CF5633A|nr:lactonase family protein [Actinocrinis sp.]HXR74096.1 lactonase family protein [Actinocrinis sp.]